MYMCFWHLCRNHVHKPFRSIPQATPGEKAGCEVGENDEERLPERIVEQNGGGSKNAFRRTV